MYIQGLGDLVEIWKTISKLEEYEGIYIDSKVHRVFALLESNASTFTVGTVGMSLDLFIKHSSCNCMGYIYVYIYICIYIHIYMYIYIYNMRTYNVGKHLGNLATLSAEVNKII